METENRNNNDSNYNYTFFKFDNLRIYHKALDYANWVYSVTEDFNSDNQKHLKERFLKAAQYISINIAEGSGLHKTQFVTHLKTAKSAIRKCVVMSDMALKMGYFDEEKCEESKNYLIEIYKMTRALITSLQKGPRRNEQNTTEEIEKKAVITNDNDDFGNKTETSELASDFENSGY